MSISGDELRDIELGDDRQIYLDADNDLAVTEGVDTVKQSVAIAAGSVVRGLVGDPLNGRTYEELQEELRRAIEQDAQISTVNSIDIEEVNKIDGTVTLTVTTSYNNSFEVQIQQ